VIIEIRNLSFAYHSKPVLSDINIKLVPGITAILGPNASGKSTLIKCLFGILKSRGEILFDNKHISAFHRNDLSKIISYLPQESPVSAVLTVFEAVLIGRIHQLGWKISRDDVEFVNQLLKEVGLTDIAERMLNELSGGQRQMVFITQTIAKNPQLLLMDEPTSNLDLQHQFQICEWIKSLTVSRDMCTVIALHDINIAARFADRICVLKEGKVFAQGDPASVITSKMIASLYNIEASVKLDEFDKPLVTPLRAIKSK